MTLSIIWVYAIGITLAYLLGSIPFGFLIAKTRGVDIRTVGSKNIGATNVYRTLGKKLGILTFALDFAKGMIAVTIIPWIIISNIVFSYTSLLFEGREVTVITMQFLDYSITPMGGPDDLGMVLAIVCSVAVIIGHSFPVWLKFKGGKGVATGAGILIGMAPVSAIYGIITFGIVFGLFRYVSLASMCAAIVVAVSAWMGGFIAMALGSYPTVRSSILGKLACAGAYNFPIVVMLTILAVLVVIRHRTNIVRLLKGTENRFSFKRKSEVQKSGNPE